MRNEDLAKRFWDDEAMCAYPDVSTPMTRLVALLDEACASLRERTAEAEDKAVRFDLDKAGIEKRDSEAVELVELRARLAEAEEQRRYWHDRYGAANSASIRLEQRLQRLAEAERAWDPDEPSLRYALHKAEQRAEKDERIAKLGAALRDLVTYLYGPSDEAKKLDSSVLFHTARAALVESALEPSWCAKHDDMTYACGCDHGDSAPSHADPPRYCPHCGNTEPIYSCEQCGTTWAATESAPAPSPEPEEKP